MTAGRTRQPWRYGLSLLVGTLAGTACIGVTLGLAWLAVTAAAVTAIAAAAVAWPVSRRRLAGPAGP